jgi:D-lactate dehydrogenase (cytochrome)
MVAANVNSPQRRRDGGIRDVLLATTVAMADGRVIRAGRPVVKNVAGYDLPKLFAGSNGTLGLLVDVTLRLLPQPRLRRTLALPAQTPEQGLAWAAATAPVWLATSSVVLCQSAAVAGIERAPFTLLWTLEGVAEDVIAETAALDAALRSARAPSLVEVAQPAAAALWASFVARRGQNSLLLRVGVPAGQLQDYWRQIAGGAEARGIWCFDPGNSLAYATHGAGNDPAAAAAWVERMRAPALTLGGYAVVMQTPPGLSTQIDRWGYRPDALALMQALKAQWDPAGILNPGDSVAG